MKKILTSVVLTLSLSVVVIAGQSGNTAPKKAPAKTTVDCSTVNDTTLASNVKDKLAGTPSLKDFALNVAAKDGAVTLTGNVKSGRNKGTATLQAKRVACVKKVDNQITVEPAPAKPSKSGQ